MKKCPYCAEEIQDEAVICRYCHSDLRHPAAHPQEPPKSAAPPATDKRPPKRGAILAAATIAVLCFAFSAIAFINSSTPRPTPTPPNDNDAAIVMCRQFVEQRLKSPGTAKYPTLSETSVTRGGDVYTVESWVDSQNGFGALIRTNYTCMVSHAGGVNWALVSLEFTEP